MGLYNMVHGTNDSAGMLLGILGFKSSGDIPRFRDCYLDTENKRICVHTRTGGGNRVDYEKDRVDESWRDEDDDPYEGPWNDDLREIAGFIKDEDDDFDSTYATFYYKFPKEFKADLEEICGKIGHVDSPSEKWEKLFDAMDKKS